MISVRCGEIFMHLSILQILSFIAIISSPFTAYSLSSLKIFFSSQERDSILTSTDPYNVTGHLEGNLNESQLSINNHSVVFSNNGSFFYTLFPKTGLNLISATALENGKPKAYTTRSMYQSDSWLPFNETTNSTDWLSNIIQIHVDRSIIPDSLNILQKGYGPGYAIQTQLSQINMTELALKPIFDKIGTLGKSTAQYHLKGYIRSINALNPIANASLLEEGINLSGSFASQNGLNGFSALLEVQVQLLLTKNMPLSLGRFFVTYVAENVDFEIKTNIQKDENQPLNITITNFTLQTTGDDLTAKSSPPQANTFFQPWTIFFPAMINAWIDWIGNKVLDSYKQELINNSIKEISHKISEILAASSKNIPPEIELNVDISTENIDWSSYHPDLKLDWQLNTLKIGSDHITASFNTKVATTQNLNHQTKPVFLRKNCKSKNIQFTNQNFPHIPISSQISVDYINQIFHVLWWGGLFDMNFNFKSISLPNYHLLHINNLSANFQPRMPPILNDCDTQVPHLEIGDMKVNISFEALGQSFNIQAYASASATANFQTNGDKIKIFILSPLVTSFDIIETNNLLFISDFWLEELFNLYLLPMVEEKLKSTQIFSFSIPNIPLYQIFNWLTKNDNLVFDNLTTSYRPGTIEVNGYVN